ncbi:MAG: esterase [Flavobacteriaceae bacterium]|nr:esterase [Flavobacteriaceae bacterium]
MEKEVSYTHINSYSTLNNLTDKTKNIWFICHGIGYLSRYFLKYFDELDREENYIIAPQAQSKYYLGSKYKHVGASWLTKENTAMEINNVMNYFDAVLAAEEIPDTKNFIVLGYSQGVSVATRYIANRKLNCSQLVFLSGRFPNELSRQDFEFLKNDVKVSFIYGNKDEYITDEILADTKLRFHNLFDHRGEIHAFEGKHEVNKEVLKNLI